MNRKQNTPKYRNIARLGSPVVNFCVRLPEYLLCAHEHDSPGKLVPIPLLNEQEAKYFHTIFFRFGTFRAEQLACPQFLSSSFGTYLILLALKIRSYKPLWTLFVVPKSKFGLKNPHFGQDGRGASNNGSMGLDFWYSTPLRII
jgi:hypothetical protein